MSPLLVYTVILFVRPRKYNMLMKNFFYRVAKGETLLSVSRSAGVPPCVIVRENNLTGEIEEGDLLFISRPNGKIYYPRPQDTAESVAKEFGVSAEKILSENGLIYLFYGAPIVIPERD